MTSVPGRTRGVTGGNDMAAAFHKTWISAHRRRRGYSHFSCVARSSLQGSHPEHAEPTQGCSSCDQLSVRLRKHLRNWLYAYGCWVYHHRAVVLILGTLFLLGLCLGLKKAEMETRVESLWIEENGRLEEEAWYTNRYLGAESLGTSELLIQIGISSPGGDQVPALLHHLSVLTAAARFQVDALDQQWSLSDLCAKPTLPDIENNQIKRILWNFLPCIIITPLDCFWEGSFLHGPFPAMHLPHRKNVSWRTIAPGELLDDLARLNLSLSLDSIRDTLADAGALRGYLDKPCLNSSDPECPQSIHKSGDVLSALSGGCSGFASKFMAWPEQLILGGVKRTRSGQVRSLEAIQSIIQLMSPHQVYEAFLSSARVNHIRPWNIDKAKVILEAWKQNFTELVKSTRRSEQHQVYAMTSSSFSNLIQRYSSANLYHLAGGYALMMGYSMFALLCWRDTVHSHSALGCFGVLVVSLAVAAGLGLCSVCGLLFNSASTQVLPFLALGIGMDDMFLLARSFSNLAMASDRPMASSVLGKCLESVGLSVLLTSFTNAFAFGMAAIIPIPALRTFSLQVCIVIIINLGATMTVFASLIAFDATRMANSRYDVFCCSDRVEVVTRPPAGHESPPLSMPTPTGDRSSHPHMQVVTGVDCNVQVRLDSDAACMIQLNSVFNYQPAGSGVSDLGANGMILHPFTWPRAAASSAGTVESRWRSVAQPLPIPLARTHSTWMGYLVGAVLADVLTKMPVKVLVIFLFALFFGLATHGALSVRDGIDMQDVVPHDSDEHDFVKLQFEYFSFYYMGIVTRGIPYHKPEVQLALERMHATFKEVDKVVLLPDGELQPFWLVSFRKWLEGLQKKFDTECTGGCFIGKHQVAPNVTFETRLAILLLSQTSDPHGHASLKNVMNNRLVEDDIINPDLFYTLLTAWYSMDTIRESLTMSQIRPRPESWGFSSRNLLETIPMAKPIQFAQMMFYLNNLSSTEDFVSLIKSTRSICQEFASEGVGCYPTGIPFAFWEQYISLRWRLGITVGVIIVVTGVVIAILLMNVWASFIVVTVLAMTFWELFGMMGLIGLKLSAVPAVTLIVSVGIGVEFTVHLTLAFITASGDRNQRTASALKSTALPVLDGAISTLLGVSLLAFSSFTFVIRYFLVLIVVLVVVGAANGLILLPVLLSLLGPCSEETHIRVDPRSEDPSQTSLPQRPVQVCAPSSPTSCSDDSQDRFGQQLAPAAKLFRQRDRQLDPVRRESFGHPRFEPKSFARAPAAATAAGGRPVQLGCVGDQDHSQIPGAAAATDETASTTGGGSVARVKATATVTVELQSSRTQYSKRSNRGEATAHPFAVDSNFSEGGEFSI